MGDVIEILNEAIVEVTKENTEQSLKSIKPNHVEDLPEKYIEKDATEAERKRIYYSMSRTRQNPLSILRSRRNTSTIRSKTLVKNDTGF
jgi:hypothetical protein